MSESFSLRCCCRQGCATSDVTVAPAGGGSGLSGCRVSMPALRKTAGEVGPLSVMSAINAVGVPSTGTAAVVVFVVGSLL